MTTVRHLIHSLSAPGEVVHFLADQLKVPPEGLSAYGRRAQTRTDHFLAVQEHLGYRKAGPEEREQLARWLVGDRRTSSIPQSHTLLFACQEVHLYFEIQARNSN